MPHWHVRNPATQPLLLHNLPTYSPPTSKATVSSIRMRLTDGDNAPHYKHAFSCTSRRCNPHRIRSHQTRNCSQFTPAGRAAARLAYNTVRARHSTVVRAHRSPLPEGTSCEPRFELRTCPRHASPRTHRAACESRGMRSRSSSAWEHRLRAAVVPAPAWARRRST